MTKSKPVTPKEEKSDKTRESLIQAGITLFGDAGFDGVSNRELANTAKVNQALISYHFGGKEGLYLAIFEYIADTINREIALTLTEVQEDTQKLIQELEDTAIEKQHIERSIRSFESIFSAFQDLLLNPEFEGMTALIMREQLAPTKAFDIFWEGANGKILSIFTQLIAITQGRLDTNQSDHLKAITLVGQLLVFKVARATVCHHLNWDAPSSEQNLSDIKSQLAMNIRAFLTA